MVTVAVLAGVAGLGIGAAAGYIACVERLVRPVQEQLVQMKKQGFVPQFEIEQQIEEDPSRHVRER